MLSRDQRNERPDFLQEDAEAAEQNNFLTVSLRSLLPPVNLPNLVLAI